MVQEELIDMTNETERYCISWITIQMVEAGLKVLIPAWNNHPIPSNTCSNLLFFFMLPKPLLRLNVILLITNYYL